MQTKRLLGVGVTCAVALVPIILWLVFTTRGVILTDTTQKIDALAKAAALSGFALLSFNIILSARLPIFERLFLGLDRAYRAHRIIGGSVLILLMLHGASITAKYSNISLLSGYEYLKPNFDIALMLGKIALVMMILLISVSIYIKVKYQWFVMIQRVLGAMIFLGGYHALFVAGSDVRSNTPLFIYLALLGGTAACLYVYRSLFHKSLKRKLEYTVQSVWRDQGITVVWLRPTHNALAFYAGQFAFFQFSSGAVDKESHPFSMSSSSDDSSIRIAAKASGDYTSKISGLSVGEGVAVEGPYGHFSFTKIRGTKQVWVAGGIGITPFLSMVYSLPSDYQVTLYYCVRTLSQAVFKEEIEEAMREKTGLKVVILCDDQNQKITAKEMVSAPAEDYLLCAPPAMMHSLEKQLRTLGVAKQHIHYEDFALT